MSYPYYIEDDYPQSEAAAERQQQESEEERLDYLLMLLDTVSEYVPVTADNLARELGILNEWRHYAKHND